MVRPAAALLLLLHCFGSSLGEYTSQSLSTFVDTLLAEYDREAPPQPSTDVALSLDVRHATVLGYSSTMRLLADLHMRWNDSRLTWNASAWSGESVLVPAERLWAPEVWLASAGSVGGVGGAALRARVGAGGAVAAVQRLDVAVPLVLRLEAWPRDKQQASFKFTSRVYSDTEINLLIEDDTHSLVVESGAWEVVGVTGSQWGAGAAWTVRVVRRGAAQAAAAGAVLGAALALLAAAAVLPCPQRAPLAAASSSLAAAWLLTAVSQVPQGASTPHVVSLMCATCVCGAAAGALAAAAAGLARRTAPPPAALRALLSRVSALYTLAPDPEGAAGGAWRAAARLLDAAARAALLLALLVLAALHLLV